MKKIIIFFLIFLAGCANQSSLQNNPSNSMNGEPSISLPTEQIIYSSKKKVSIGVLLPQEGPYKEVTDNIIDAIQLAYNNKKNVVIHFYNTFSNGKDNTIAAAKAAVSGGSDIIIGPLFATHLPEIAKIAAKKNIPVISFSNDRSALIDTNNVYIMGYSPEVEVERIVDYVTNTQNAVRFVALLPENKYGGVLLSSLRATLAARGLNLVKVVTYPPDTINFTPYVEKLIDSEELKRYTMAVKEYNISHSQSKNNSLIEVSEYPTLNLGFDTLFVGDSGNRLMLLGVHLPYVGIDTTQINFIGTRLLGNANLFNEKVFYNIAFPDYINLPNTIFASKFTGIFKTKPTLLSACAYDAVQMITSLVKTDPNTGAISYDFSPQSLTSQTNLGVVGNFKLRLDGLTERDMEIKGVSSRGFNVIDNSVGYGFMAVENYKKIPVENIIISEKK